MEALRRCETEPDARGGLAVAAKARDMMKVHHVFADPMGIAMSGQWGPCEARLQVKEKWQAVQWIDGPDKTGSNAVGDEDFGVNLGEDKSVGRRGALQLEVQELELEQQPASQERRKEIEEAPPNTKEGTREAPPDPAKDTQEAQSDPAKETREAPSDRKEEIREEPPDPEKKTQEVPLHSKEETREVPLDHEEETREVPLDPEVEKRKVPLDLEEETREVPLDPEEGTQGTPSGPTEKTREAPSDGKDGAQGTPSDSEDETLEAPSDPLEETLEASSGSEEETKGVVGLAEGPTELEGPAIPARRKLTISGNLPSNNVKVHVELAGVRRRGRSSTTKFSADERGRRRRECVDVRRRGHDNFPEKGGATGADSEGHATGAVIRLMTAAAAKDGELRHFDAEEVILRDKQGEHQLLRGLVFRRKVELPEPIVRDMPPEQ